MRYIEVSCTFDNQCAAITVGEAAVTDAAVRCPPSRDGGAVRGPAVTPPVRTGERRSPLLECSAEIRA